MADEASGVGQTTASEIQMACAWRGEYAGGGGVRRLMQRQAASR